MTGFSSSVRAVIIERAQWYCERCGVNRGVEAHHRRARGMGGTRRTSTNQPSAGLWLCRHCHTYIESHRTEALHLGFLVRQNEEPIDVPVFYRETWVRLDNFGNMNDAKKEAV